MSYKLLDCHLSYTEVEHMLDRYRDHFAGKSIYCIPESVLDDSIPKYLVNNFNRMNLKELVLTHYPEEYLKFTQEDSTGNKCEFKPFFVHIDNVGSFPLYRNLINENLQMRETFSGYELLVNMAKADVIIAMPPRGYLSRCVNLIQVVQKDFILLIPNSQKDLFPDQCFYSGNTGYHLDKKNRKVNNDRSHVWAVSKNLYLD